MNKIYKTVWNALRRCYVVVSEATGNSQSCTSGTLSTVVKSALITAIGSIGIASALGLPTGGSYSGTISTDGTYNLSGIGESYTFTTQLQNFSVLRGNGVNLNLNQGIYAPSAQVELYSNIKHDWLVEHDLLGASWDEIVAYVIKEDLSSSTDLSTFQIDGDVDVRLMELSGVGTINGNVMLHGTITRDQLYVRDYATDAGYVVTGGAYNLGGIVINGNLTASLVSVLGYQPNPGTFDHLDRGTACSGLIVNGDVVTDWLVVDTAIDPDNPDMTYDKYTDYLQDVMMSGKMLITGKLTVNGTFYNAFGDYVEKPDITDASNVIYGLQPPAIVASEIGELNAIKIVNASNLFVGKLTNDTQQVYTQAYGTIQVKDNWFKDSIINMSGGIIDEASLGPDKNLGINNVFNVTGGTLKVDDLNFDSTVNLSKDGKIETQIESIFVNPDGDPEALNYVALNGAQPEDVKASLTKWFTNYVPGTLRTDLEDHVNFEGGSIVVSGFGQISQTQYEDLLAAFKGAFFSSKTRTLFHVCSL